MTALGVRKTTYNGLSVRNKEIVKYLGDFLQLGEPAEFNASGTLWYVFDDHRFKPVHIAYFGCLLANLGDIPGGYTIPTIDILDDQGAVIGTKSDRPQMRADIKNFCEDGARTNPLVLPKDITFTEDGNPWQEILDAQGAPAAVQMASGVPASWVPVSDA